ncbi:AMP-binding protein [Brevibacillus nitrificans]|uniref:AMP-binding protein n=1 Tax=Brevibacillus nitrificans TaxID=651560 RepID=UPI002856CCAD|nr:AMP-binding protein [Brevibacillus nitrificans]MDR7316782.1 long-chain acyl-CoA synthetase [Brevibacillus nitrificans]
MSSSIHALNRMAVGDILRRSTMRHPDKVAAVDKEKRVTYRQLNDTANRFARFLHDQGLQSGDRVACVCLNSVEFLAVMFGVAKAGMVWVPINPLLAAPDIAYIIEHSDARLLVVEDSLFAKVEPILPGLNLLESIVTLPIAGGEIQTGILAFPQAIAPFSAEERYVDMRSEDLALIMYTSGTTGKPKGVMQNHLSVCVAALGNVIEMEMQKDDVASCMMPLFHCAQHVLAMSMLAVGGTLIILRGFEPASFFRTVEKEGMTWMFALPVMYRSVLDHPEAGHYDTSSLRYCLYAMAPMDEPTLRRGIERFGARFALATGQTEMYPATMVFKPEEQLRRFGSYWGTSSLILDTAIMDEEGNFLPPGEIGEIVHRGPTVMMGYWKNEQATEEARTHGWHHTGDLGFWDADGQLQFVDRKKDMIKSGGENVPSIKVESVLLKDSRVMNAAAVGLPHARWSEGVTGFVTLKPGAACTEAELIAHCRSELAGFEVPKAIVFLEQFPVTATGKIQKNVLRQRYASYYDNQADEQQTMLDTRQ